MGILIAVEASEPLLEVEHVRALLRLRGAVRVCVELATRDRGVIHELVRHADGDARISLAAAKIGPAIPHVARYARTRAAGYVDARHAGGTLRVWRDHVWVDSLLLEPRIDGVHPRVEQPTGRTLFDLRTTDLEAAIAVWVDAANGDALEAWASAAPLESLGIFLDASEAPIEVRSEAPVDVAARLMRALPDHPIALSHGELEIAHPEGTARIWCVAPVSAKDEAAIHALFDACRR